VSTGGPFSRGANRSFSALTPIIFAHQKELISLLTSLPSGPAGPFGQLADTHFARFVVVDAFDVVPPDSPRIGPLVERYLVYTSHFHGRVNGHLEALRLRAGPVVDEIWGHCIGYPGRWDRRRFTRYLRHNQVHSGLSFSGYSASPTEIKAALALREQHVGFALASQSMPAGERRQAFLATFGPGGSTPNA
jgi:hypothetical protein